MQSKRTKVLSDLHWLVFRLLPPTGEPEFTLQVLPLLNWGGIKTLMFQFWSYSNLLGRNQDFNFSILIFLKPFGGRNQNINVPILIFLKPFGGRNQNINVLILIFLKPFGGRNQNFNVPILIFLKSLGQ